MGKPFLKKGFPHTPSQKLSNKGLYHHSALCTLFIVSQKLLFVKLLLHVFLAQKVFHTCSLIMCKTVENSVDCAENLHIPAKIRHFSYIYAKKLWKTF